MVPFIPSTSNIAAGEAEAVGVHFIKASDEHPPLRIYYPASGIQEGKKEVGFFQDTSALYFIQGYWSVIMSRKRNTMLYRIGLFILSLVTWILPLNYIKVRGLYEDAPPVAVVAKNKKDDDGDDGNKLPLILFSHGLTGSGQENSVLCSAWAKLGYVVISVHHTDGSSNCVRLADGTDLWYEPGPPFVNYDANFRPKQIQKRVDDLVRAREFLLCQQQQQIKQSSPSSSTKNSFSIEAIASLFDWERTIVSGFSYGAATAASVAAKKEQIMPSLTAAIFLDGWFFVDVMKSANIEFKFPKEAFDEEETKYLKEIPAIFINSSQFMTFPKLWNASILLSNRFKTMKDAPYIIENSSHNNFTDLIFWFPTWILQKGKAIGIREPKKAYKDIVHLTLDFLKQQQ